jgi:hypothetical protein
MVIYVLKTHFHFPAVEAENVRMLGLDPSSSMVVFLEKDYTTKNGDFPACCTVQYRFRTGQKNLVFDKIFIR